MLYDKRWEEKELPVAPKPNRRHRVDRNNWREILLRAAELIEEVGWCKRSFVKFKRGVAIGYCTLGALNHAAGSTVGDAREEAEDRLAECVGGIVSWNDEDAKSKEEVIAKLREVANAGN